MKFLHISVLFIVLTSVKFPVVFADGHCSDNLIGINLAGAEFGKNIPGREGYDYFFPSESQIVYYKKIGFHLIRLPIMWERLQPELNGPLNPEYLAGIISVLNSAAKNGMTVLIDLHNYGHYQGKLIGSPAVSKAAFFDVWQKLARALSPYKALDGYGLMNEPYDTSGSWPQIAQSAIDGIRSVDSSHHIYVAVENSGDSRIWETNFVPFVKDPKNLEVYETHAYFDADYSGKYISETPRLDPRALADESLKPFLAWLTKYGKKGAVGEWGVPHSDTRWFPAVDHMVEISRANCLPIYYWAGGNWGPDYKLGILPIDGDGTGQLLKDHFKATLK